MPGHLAFAVPGNLATPTGGYAYDRRVLAELCEMGWLVDLVTLGDDFPRPSERSLAEAEAELSALPEGLPIVIDGLAFGAMPALAADLAARHPLIALVHHPLALETGLDPDVAEALRADERDALAAARHVIVTSQTTARILALDYGVSSECITVALPGTDAIERETPQPARAGDGTVRLLAVGAVVPRKGYDILLAALAQLATLRWTLTIAGPCDRNIEASVQLVADIVRFNLKDRVQAVGAVPDERLALLYAEADLFVLASRYEGYGMAYAEAIAHGLPVIGTTGGAVPEVVPADAGILVAPDDVAALAAALRRLIADADERSRYAAGAQAAAARLPRWRDTAQRIADTVERAR